MRYKVTLPAPSGTESCLMDVEYIIETDGPKTPMGVKDQACRESLFSWGDYQRLRVRRLP